MKGAATVLQAILIFAIAISLVTVSVPWLYNSLQKSMDISEMSTIREQMVICNGKLVETARTGTSNRCMFSADRGKITAQEDGIYYNLLTEAKICDQYPWREVDKERHLESKCDISYGIRNYDLRWRWPSSIEMEGEGFEGEILKEGESNNDYIEFDDIIEFNTITVIVKFDFIPGQAGKIVDISRLDLTEEMVTLSVNIR